jgi:hypothetical protein
LADLAIFYEHPAWFEPLFAALDRRGVAYLKLPIQDHIYDPANAPPPAPVILSRLAMSSFLRDAEHALFYADALFEHWEAQGARVINGARSLGVDISKARQMGLIRRLGYATPETRVVHRLADLPRAAEGLRFPILVKADVGGSGAGIARYDSMDSLADAAEAGTAPMGVNGVTLVQEYAPRRGGKITRVETLGGDFLYAVDVESSGDGFDLCPADFCLAQPGKPKIAFRQVDPGAEVVAAVEKIVRVGGFDIAGVEYLVDDRDGSLRFYDINGLSNFVADPMTILGWDPHENLVDWLVAEIAQQRKAAA